MIARINKEEVARRLTARMHCKEQTASAWLDAMVETLYDAFKEGNSVTLPGLGGFYLRPEPRSCVFKLTRRSGCGRSSAGLQPTKAICRKMNDRFVIDPRIRHGTPAQHQRRRQPHLFV